jgi:hypothetical protein
MKAERFWLPVCPGGSDDRQELSERIERALKTKQAFYSHREDNNVAEVL